MLTPDQFLALAKKDRKLIKTGAGKPTVAKVLRLLAPAYGYTTLDVSNAWNASEDGDLLAALQRDPSVGHLVPGNLLIGGHTGLTAGDVLSLKFHKKKWWARFMAHVEDLGEVIWVLPMKSMGYWVIHNTTISSGRSRHAIVIPAHKQGLNHIQVIRLELFIKEKQDG
jgi:hypothetical protein